MPVFHDDTVLRSSFSLTKNALATVCLQYLCIGSRLGSSALRYDGVRACLEDLEDIAMTESPPWF